MTNLAQRSVLAKVFASIAWQFYIPDKILLQFAARGARIILIKFRFPPET